MSSTPGPSNRQETSATPQMGVLNINNESDNEDAANNRGSHFNVDHQQESNRNHTARTLRLSAPNPDDDECGGETNMLNISTPMTSATANPNDRENFNPGSSRSSSTQNPGYGFGTPYEQTTFDDYGADENTNEHYEEAEEQRHEDVAHTVKARTATEEQRSAEDDNQTIASLCTVLSPPKPNPKPTTTTEVHVMF